MRDQKKFHISWINDQSVSNDYFEIWGLPDLLEDFKGDKELCIEIDFLKLGKSLIYFNDDGIMMVITRVAKHLQRTI